MTEQLPAVCPSSPSILDLQRLASALRQLTLQWNAYHKQLAVALQQSKQPHAFAEQVGQQQLAWHHRQVEQGKLVAAVAPLWACAVRGQPIPSTQREVFRQQLAKVDAALFPQSPAPETITRSGGTLKRTRRKSRKYADREYFVKCLGEAIDALRQLHPGREPTNDEIGLCNDMVKDIVEHEPWPEGMSPSTLKRRAGKKEHNINIPDFVENRPRPRMS
jgi:hypothetical protein